MNSLVTVLTASAMALLISLMVTVGKDAAFGDGATISVDELAFVYDEVNGPAIRQSRTVRGKGVVYGVWEASIKRKDNNEIVCSGEGFWPYSVGAYSPVLPVDLWVGQEDCWDDLPEYVQLQACAQYYVADNSPSTACSLGFMKVSLDQSENYQ